MKKLVFVLFVSLIGISCSVDDVKSDYYYEILPIESYELPTSFELGKIYTIKVSYKRPTDCHTKPSLYFEKNGNTRTIAIQSLVVNRGDCQPVPDEEPKEGTFQFEVLSSEPYLFKFYKGQNENDEDVFEEVTVPVYY